MSAELIEYNPDDLDKLKKLYYHDTPNDIIQLFLDYCKASKIDPFGELCHITKRNVKNKKTGQWEERYKITPGIGLYRLKAHRSGCYAGISEPQYGPLIKEKIGTKEVEYPEWCMITIRKIVQGHICEFVAVERWKENYATMSYSDPTPADMWVKRNHGQLAKCTESQAIKKAFSELVGNVATIEEMEGKKYFDDEEDFIPAAKVQNVEALKNRLKPEVIQAKPVEVIPIAVQFKEDANEFNKDELLDFLRSLMKDEQTPQKEVDAWLKKANVSFLSDLTEYQVKQLIIKLQNRKMKKEGVL